MATVVRLKRQLTLIQGVSVICGLVIGSGIFIAPKGVLQGTSSVGLCLVVWFMAGILATLGALSFAELGTTFPSGGEKYHYLEKMFGPFVGFSYLWMYLNMFRPGANAIKCMTFAVYILKPIFPDCEIPHSCGVLTAICLACILTYINCVNVRWAVRGQTFFTSIGILSLAIISITGFVYIALGSHRNLKSGFEGSETNVWEILLSFYSGILAIWGWNAANFMIEELKDPYRNLPYALYISMALVTVLYLGVNISYLAVLGIDGVLTSEAVAVSFAQKTLGVMSWIMPVFIAINTAGSFNSGSLVGSRLCFAGARRGHLPDILALIHVKYLSPMPALMYHLILVIIMICTTDLYGLLNTLVFMNNLFDCVNVAGQIWWRYKYPDLPRPIKMHILIPVIFFVCMVMLTVASLVVRTRESLISLLLIFGTAVPYYIIFVIWDKKPAAYKKWIGVRTSQIQKLMYCSKQDD